MCFDTGKAVADRVMVQFIPTLGPTSRLLSIGKTNMGSQEWNAHLGYELADVMDVQMVLINGGIAIE